MGSEKSALYIRVSTEEQAEKGASIEAQEEFLEDWAKKEDFEVYGTYTDKGYSGKNLKRPALQKLIKDAKNKKFSVVLCYHNDRLSRDTKDALTITQELLRYEVRFRFSNLDVDITSPEGELFFTLQAGFATYFRKDLARKTKFGMQKIKKDGYWIGRIPDLFEVEREKHTKVTPSKTALRIKELRQMKLSYRKIAIKVAEEFEIDINHVKIYRTLKTLEKLKLQ
ncbi:MAG TPA: recombinase family protein [Euryarchaeota archaeon]|nr:transposon Tn3 resolvase [archaeon BMS3Bbin15]HDL15366.1 recombinase family protein [Euryarchaeota archaeon]